MVEIASPRARLVEALWQLKQVCDQQDDKGLRYMHFNTMLKDPNYRGEIIDRAATSRNPKIRVLADQLRQLDNREVLVQAKFSAGGRRENPDITATRASAGPGQSRQRPPLGALAIIALVLVAGAAVVTYFYEDLRFALSGKTVVTGSLFGAQRWGADRQWVLDGIVYVEANAQLVIDPGTQVLGRPGSALVVTRDATLHARGTASAPIVFTSAQPAGQRKAGDWGGLVMLGNAPVNVADARIEGVPLGDTRAAFGGTDADANCGVLEYARIEFAGFEVYADNELNGLTLGGCGSNTIVRNVQVHRALDDGIEVFGGTVDLKQVLITGAADDSLDWDMGWRGRVQFMVIQQHFGVGDNGIEADNRSRQHHAEPVSEPVLYNVTLVSANSTDKVQRAMTLRRGTGGHFHNVIIEGFSGEAIDVRDAETAARIEQGMMSFGGVLFNRTGSDGRTYFSAEAGEQDDDGGFGEAAFFAAQASRQNLLFDRNPNLPDTATSATASRFTPTLGSVVERAAVPVPEGEFWDEAAAYLGAMRPGVNSTWTDGWTAFPAH